MRQLASTERAEMCGTLTPKLFTCSVLLTSLLMLAAGAVSLLSGCVGGSIKRAGLHLHPWSTLIKCSNISTRKMNFPEMEMKNVIHAYSYIHINMHFYAYCSTEIWIIRDNCFSERKVHTQAQMYKITTTKKTCVHTQPVLCGSHADLLL